MNTTVSAATEPSVPPLTPEQAKGIQVFFQTHWKGLLIILAVVLVLLAGGYGVWLLTQRQTPSKSNPIEQKVTKQKLTGKVGQVTDLKAPKQSTFVWDVPEQRQLQVRVAGENCYLYPGEAGIFYAGYSFVEENQVHLVQFEVEVSGGPAPIISPTPPTPQPVAVTGPLFIVVVDNDAKTDLKKFFIDTKLTDRILGKSHRWRLVDKLARDSGGAEQDDLVYWVDQAKAKKLPRLLLLDRAGKLRFESELAELEPAMLLAELTKAGG